MGYCEGRENEKGENKKPEYEVRLSSSTVLSRTGWNHKGGHWAKDSGTRGGEHHPYHKPPTHLVLKPDVSISDNFYVKGRKCTTLYEMGKDPRTYIVKEGEKGRVYIIKENVNLK